MKEYEELIVGLVVGLALTFLNNSIVHDSISCVFTLLDPKDFKFLFIGRWISVGIYIISFIGIFVTLAYSFLILKKLLKK